jgi:hypothetical protein
LLASLSLFRAVRSHRCQTLPVNWPHPSVKVAARFHRREFALRRRRNQRDYRTTLKKLGGPVGDSKLGAPTTIFVADAHRGDGKRLVVRADEKLTAFLELESAIRGLRRIGLTR